MNIECPLCCSKNIDDFPWHEWKDTNGKEYRLKKCNYCGSAFTYPLPTDSYLREFYKTSFNYGWYRDHLLAKRRDSKSRFKEYKDLLGECALDYGGGLGYFSEVCRENGIESITYDPYTSDTITEKKWDSVVALHVLEHSNNPNHFVEHIKSNLKDGGKLVLAVPNFSGLGYARFKMDWVWAQPPFLHIFHLTADGVVALLKRNGFESIQVTYHERWDANNYADVFNRQAYATRDALWAHKFINRYTFLRKIVALSNSMMREYALFRSRKIVSRDEDCSEIQIVAIKGITKE